MKEPLTLYRALEKDSLIMRIQNHRLPSQVPTLFFGALRSGYILVWGGCLREGSRKNLAGFGMYVGNMGVVTSMFVGSPSYADPIYCSQMKNTNLSSLHRSALIVEHFTTCLNGHPKSDVTRQGVVLSTQD